MKKLSLHFLCIGIFSVSSVGIQTLFAKLFVASLHGCLPRPVNLSTASVVYDTHCVWILPCAFGWSVAQAQSKENKARASDQNGISWLYTMLEIHHSGRKPSKRTCVFIHSVYLIPETILTYMYMCVPHVLMWANREKKHVSWVDHFGLTHILPQSRFLGTDIVCFRHNVHNFQNKSSANAVHNLINPILISVH